MIRPLTKVEIAGLAADLRAIIDVIVAGGVDATTATRHRIEGALAVLEVVLGRSPRKALGLPEPGAKRRNLTEHVSPSAE